MVIGYDGSEAFVKNRTGVENYAYQLLLHLSKIDHKNQYLIYLDPRTNDPKKVGNWPSNFKFQILNFKLLWTQGGLALHSFTDPLDLLFVPAHTIPVLRRPGLKTVMTVHDLGSEYLPAMHQLKQRLYLDFITKLQLKTATKLIAVSKATKEDLIKKVGVDAKNINVIYEGINKYQNKAIVGEIKVNRLRQIDREKSNYFLFVSTIQPRKNLKRLIIAYALFLEDLRKKNPKSNPLNLKSLPKLILAGGKGWLSDEIYELPKKLGIEKDVKFLGRVSDQQPKSLYKNALAFVYPSLYEGFGLPILEAMSYGLPVITSNISSMPEVAGDSAILVDPHKVEEIRKALAQIYQDKNLRQKLKLQGQQRLKQFSWTKSAKETLQLFESFNQQK